MKAGFVILAVFAASFVSAQIPEAADPADVLRQIDGVRAQAPRTGEGSEAAKAKIASIVEAAVKGVDPAKVSYKDAKDWLRLFQLAQNESGVLVLAKRVSDQMSFELMEINQICVSSLIAKGEFVQAQTYIRDMGFVGGPALIGQFHMGIRSALLAKAKTNLPDVLKTYDILASRVSYREPLTSADRNWGPVAYADIIASKYAALFEAGKQKEALASLRKLSAQMAKYKDSKTAYNDSAKDMVEKVLSSLTGIDTLHKVVGQPYPKLVFDRTLGDFKGLDSFKGKVLVLDFMAHWCGPCRAALPSLAKLQQDFGAQGLQVVSLTGYYGYFGAEKGLSNEQEFEKMKGFVADAKIAWPVLFDASKTNNANFGVQGIPQLVVIDRKGIVRKVEVGFTPEAFAKTVELVQSLLK